MSVTDPLISELKSYSLSFLKLHENNNPITDATENFIHFEHCLENIFHFGSKLVSSFFGFSWSCEPWAWIIKTPKSYEFEERLYKITAIIDAVKSRQNVFTNEGRFRLFVRYCLVGKCLHHAIEELLSSEKIEKYYTPGSLFRDEILVEILLSVLYHFSQINFRLDLDNSSLLDLSWELPKVVNVEVVPTKNLGISVTFAGERAIIYRIRSNSVSSERSEIQIGDIIETLNDMHLTSAMRGRFSSIMKAQRGKPISMTIIKATSVYNQQQFHPAFLKLFKDTDIDLEYVRIRRVEHIYAASEFKLVKSQPEFMGYKVFYMGNVLVGRNGDMKAIDKAYSVLMSSGPSLRLNQVQKVKVEVFFKIGELGVKFVNVESKEMVDQHSFMEISACGAVTLMPNYFSYVGGREYCNVCKKFKCYFFLAPNHDVAATVLEGIGQGFQRTHFAV